MSSTGRMTPQTSRLATAQKFVAPLPWAVMTVGILADEIMRPVTDDSKTPAILLTSLAIFFPLLVLRLVLAAVLHPSRRLTLLVLAAAIASWSLGSISVNSLAADAQTEFPAPGEWLFLISYLGMAGYLLRDGDRRQTRPARAWLDIVIICGATACLASLLLVTPVRAISHQEGVSLLLALIYPLADMILALVVLSQALMQTRIDRRKTLMIGAAFVLLAFADSGLALQGSASTYDFGNFSYAL